MTQHRACKCVIRFIILSTMLLLSTRTVYAQSSEHFTIQKWVVDASGSDATSSNFSIQYAAGQPSAIGIMSSTNFAAQSGFFGGSGVPTAVPDDPMTDLPDAFMLHQNYPNPFNPETTIEYAMPTRGRIEITIFNMRGNLVRNLIDEDKQAGLHSIVWNGMTDRGMRAGSGVYIVKIRSGRFAASSKIVMMK